MPSPASLNSLEDLLAEALAREEASDLEVARGLYNEVLRMDETSRVAAEGRARIALSLREANAVRHCIRALDHHRDHPQRQLNMITTAAGELGTAAIPLFENYLASHPFEPIAHQFLSELRAEAGAGEAFASSYEEALQREPSNKRLWLSYWNLLTRSQRLDAALKSMDANRHLFVDDRQFTLLETNTALHLGDTKRAEALLNTLDQAADAQLARGQHRLQTGQPHEASALLQDVVRAQPDNLSAWALLELAWRITQDPRHAWLLPPSLYRTQELDLATADLVDIAQALRRMHNSRAQPVGQSVRGGTQTSGQLFYRPEPEIAVLQTAIVQAIRTFVGSLPPRDPAHPLLKHRDSGIAFGPSWSVQLSGEGFHAAHFHPGGIISSACYLDLPDAVRNETGQAGWLELGRPPPELGLDLGPIVTIQPQVGRLVLFPSFLFHGTRPFAAGERLTVAFDLVPVSD